MRWYGMQHAVAYSKYRPNSLASLLYLPLTLACLCSIALYCSSCCSCITVHAPPQPDRGAALAGPPPQPPPHPQSPPCHTQQPATGGGEQRQRATKHQCQERLQQGDSFAQLGHVHATRSARPLQPYNFTLRRACCQRRVSLPLAPFVLHTPL